MSEEMFADRAEAGCSLAEHVARHVADLPEPGRPLVLALPRGGVPVAAKVAEMIGGELDIVVARKIGAPGQPEFGVGALAEDGPPVFDPAALRYIGVTEADLTRIVEHVRAEVCRRVRRYRGDRPTPEVTDRVLIVVDDGLATGVTARAALQWLRRLRPRHLVLAAPVCSTGARDALASRRRRGNLPARSRALPRGRPLVRRLHPTHRR